ncbi:RNA 2',3'-cyclic phosphodiesterase [Vibrio sp. WXL103]|uniref:RNA 2',3'-cyclic phosphodiesterase n=1 Tax=Vibrio sp. WXL103 TaxID=3450710 RepID=UPI003EC74F59
MRLFYALTFSGETKQMITQYQQRLKHQGIGGNYTALDKLHITLAFIGQTTPHQTSQLIDNLHLMRPFSLSLVIDHFGVFHHKRAPLIWLGTQPNLALKQFQHELCQTLAKQHFPVGQHQYIAHITLVRRATSVPSNLSLIAQTLPVESVALMESLPTEGRITYRIIESMPMRA